MKPSPSLLSQTADRAVSCGVAAFGSARASTGQVAALRRMPGLQGTPLPNSFLKHTDEQTVVGLAAVFEAIRRHDLVDTSFTDWGVLAAPRFLGRACLAVALQRFAQEGAWGVSPHLIPHRSLHSLSGTVSQALAIHGPNFGVGGGPASVSEVMLAALALLEEGHVPGVWVVLTGWDPEPVLDKPGVPFGPGPRPDDSIYGAAALALTPLTAAWNGSRLSLHPGSAAKAADSMREADPTLPRLGLEAFLNVLEDGCQESAVWRLECGGWLEFEGHECGAENRL